jgi:FemAB-related protein (PEP-CTERM system-associated)
MTASVVLDTDHDDWNEYVDAHPSGTPFHSWSWVESLQHSFGHEAIRLAAVRDGEVVGVLPLVAIRSRLTGTRLISTPFAGHGGPIANEAETASLLIDHARRHAEQRSADYLALHFPSDEAAFVAGDDPKTTDLYWGFRADIPDDPEDVLTQVVARKPRRMVRIGIRAGLEAEQLVANPESSTIAGATALEPWLAQAYDLLSRTMRDLGTPVYPLHLLRHLTETDPDRWFVQAVRDGDRLVAACWVARDHSTLYPQFIGADREYFKVGVSDFFYWAMICTGCSCGMRTIDMGRSKKGSGSYNFKRHFGFEPQPLGYRYYLAQGQEMPEINPNNPRYGAAISLWRQLPLGVVKVVGPRLIGHFA